MVKHIFLWLRNHITRRHTERKRTEERDKRRLLLMWPGTRFKTRCSPSSPRLGKLLDICFAYGTGEVIHRWWIWFWSCSILEKRIKWFWSQFVGFLCHIEHFIRCTSAFSACHLDYEDVKRSKYCQSTSYKFTSTYGKIFGKSNGKMKNVMGPRISSGCFFTK